MASRKPPRYVPTLTEVVGSPAEPKAAALAPISEQQIIDSVMKRVDLALERRLREVIAATIVEQTRSLAPMLREEIEAAVRETLAQAFADEMAGRRS